MSHYYLLLLEIRSRNHSHVAHEKKLVVIRILYYGAMGQCTFRRKETGLLVEDGAEELVSGAKSFHQEVSHAFPYHCNSLCDRRKLVRVVYNRELRHVYSLAFAGLRNHALVADQSHVNKSEVNGLACRRNGMPVNSPGSNHSFFCLPALEFGKYVFKFRKHCF